VDLNWLAAFPLLIPVYYDENKSAMALEGTQSDALKQLGVSYPQFVDYYSKQQAAALVSPAITCRAFIQIDVGSSLHLGTGNMGLCYHVVRTLPFFRLNIVDAPQIQRQRDRVLLASQKTVALLGCTTTLYVCQFLHMLIAPMLKSPFSRTATSRSLDFPSMSTGV
jgi:hypothetical protein